MLVDLGPLGQQNGTATFFIGAGALAVASILYTVTRAFLSIFILPGKSLSSFGPKGSYAVITGASDGLGKQFALQLAAKGFNLIVASRTQAKLDALAAEIAANPKTAQVSVLTLSIDFSTASQADYARLDSLMKGRTIAILINNVGLSHSIPVPFAETPATELTNIISINCLATLRVTQLVIPHMKAKKRGLILTMGSFGGLTPTPLLATYSGSKAFLQQWSNALASELAPDHITVHLVQGYLITSAMSKIRRSSMQVPSEKTFVRAALGKIGRRGGSVDYPYSGSPYWFHGVLAFAMTKILGTYSKVLLDINRHMHVGIRQRALRKAERDAKKK